MVDTFELLKTIATATNGGSRTEAIADLLRKHNLDLAQLPSRARHSLINKLEFAANGMTAAASRAAQVIDEAKSNLK
jgi:hypothetical protein